MWSSTDRIARAITFGVGLAITIALAPGAAIAGPGKHAGKSAAAAKKGAQSIGAPNNGHLAGAIRLRGGKTLHQREGAHSWGLPQLVHLIHHASTEVARKHRGSQMLVGDLSGRTGGHLDRHASHQTGRDADVGFYVMNSRGKPMSVKRFIAFDDAGNARDVPGARFDDARNWTLIEALLKDEKATVRYLFITNALRGRILAQAAKKHAPKALIERAAAAMMSPNDADLHDDHVHVRISCPETMRDVCVEESVARESHPAEPAAEPAADADKPGTAAAPAPAQAAAGGAG
jgi:penicillin-insensitive murein DD-endopeptidase